MSVNIVLTCVHFSFVSANILLDDQYKAKLGDFGFSIELPQISSGQTMFTAQFIARSEGYYPSELSSGKLSDRTEVYAFGVVSYPLLKGRHGVQLDW